MKKMHLSLSKGCYNFALQNWTFVGTEFMLGQMWDTDYCFKIFKFKMISLSFAFIKCYDTITIYKQSNCVQNREFIMLCEVLFTEEYSPPFYFCPFCPRCQWVNSNVFNYLSSNTTLFGARIQDSAKLFACVLCRWAKITRAKITLFTVYIH